MFFFIEICITLNHFHLSSVQSWGTDSGLTSKSLFNLKIAAKTLTVPTNCLSWSRESNLNTSILCDVRVYLKKKLQLAHQQSLVQVSLILLIPLKPHKDVQIHIPSSNMRWESLALVIEPKTSLRDSYLAKAVSFKALLS